MKALALLACPADRTRLIVGADVAHCPKCQVDYVNHNGIWKFWAPDIQSYRWPGVVEWFDERAKAIESEQILRGAPGKWHERFFKRDLVEIENFLDLKRTHLFLDVGCGNGLFLKHYAEIVEEAVGTDISFRMLERAGKEIDSKNVLLVQADSLQLPFDAASFDAVLCNWVLHYFQREEIPGFFSELRRVSREGGRIFIGEIPLARSLRGYEARAGHFLVNRFKIKVSDRYLSPVETTRFAPREIENLACEAGFEVASKGTMRHVLPSLRIPYIGKLVPHGVQHLFQQYDYRKSIPLVSYSHYLALRS